MPNDQRAADKIIEEMDDGVLSPRRHAVIRAILGGIATPTEDQQELVAPYDAGRTIDVEVWVERLWASIRGLPLDGQGALRMLV